MSATGRLVIAVTGASAPHYADRLLEVLRDRDEIETHLVVSHGARRTLALELDTTVAAFSSRADVVHHPDDLAAPISSGSFATLGMVIVPCSMKTLGLVAAGIGGDLVSRAADVSLKERRRLVLAVRETPLSLIHLRNMTAVTEAGATVMPPVPAFYQRPRTLADVIDQTTGRILEQFGIAHELYTPWDGASRPRPEEKETAP
ncbi:UbiX family flavin prenyltransferase [Microbacterium sp. SORGH_AS_0888]|uniref:UbiX family flavin prenyltransferase n=1 Tax=Microbacterium sp. SORGH_AS_0888 TaxID=3041791 RepID=UPI0027828023|nr:UbiX family flavin prenyltransferase [Microbacterium sp. SORGH_AS_0888]MDQ1129480.1 polyprenyl P-hydroxybenzoate/phenylacrylic acid decarboxylase-like protein [Microbacterium sp. SORGH_AS_0888]